MWQTDYKGRVIVEQKPNPDTSEYIQYISKEPVEESVSDPLGRRRHQQIYPNLFRKEFDLLVNPLLRGELISLEVLWKRVSVCDLGYQLVLYRSRQLKNNTALLRNLAPLMLPNIWFAKA